MCAIPACIAGGIPACLAVGLQGGACSGGGGPCSGRVCSGGCLLRGGGGVWVCGDPAARKQTATVADGTHPTGLKMHWQILEIVKLNIYLIMA